MTDRPHRVVFDLTTSAQWGRPTVGVVQTERELGRFAPEVVDDVVVEYSVYDAGRNVFHRLVPDVAAAVLDGHATVRVRSSARTRTSRLRSEMTRFARRPMQLVERTSLGATRDRGSTETPENHTAIPLDAASDAVFDLGAEDVVVSCGADWEAKDLEAIATAKRERGFGYVSICYDLIAWKHPSYWPPGVAEGVVSHYERLAEVADLVMCISRTSARDYGELCDARGLPRPRTAVFRLGDMPSTTPPETKLPPGVTSGRYVLCVGSLEPRKNHRLLYNLWDRIARDPSFPPDLKLVFAASARWMTDDLVLEIGLNTAVRDRISIVDGVSDADLHTLYASALFTVYPSFEEGWGLPVAESLAHGKACIASNRGGVGEISELAVLLDPHDFYAWQDAIVRYATDERERIDLEERIRREFAPTPWRESARSFFDTVLAVS